MATPRSDHQRQLLGGDPVVVDDAGDVRERPIDAARRIRRRRAPTKRTAARVRVPSEADRRTDESKVEDAPPPPTLPTVLSESVVERPVRTSRFKRERRRRDAAAASSSASSTAGGFPSLDAPLGTYLPKTSTTTKTKDPATTNKDVLGNDPSSMTPEEVRECVDELGATFSAETLAFLKKRGRDKMRAAAVAASTKRSDVVPDERDVATSAPEPTTTTTVVVAPPLVDDTIRKEDTARLLSSIETEEDLDRAYLNSLPVHQRAPPSKNDDDDNDPLAAAASLLRSTSSRQRSLAARRVRIELERMVNEGGDAPSHLPLLPVALRCLLDASPSSPERVALHDDVLRSLRALLRLIGGGSTTRKNIVVDEETERAADSDDRSSYATTAASASRDGAAFYRDPAWTLLSRTRFVPRAAALAATAREDAMCDLLAALAARAPGAAAAIAAPSGPLPALTRRALAPAEDFPVRPAPARACLRLLIVAAGASRTVPETTAGDLYARVAADDLLPILCATARRTNDDGARRAVRAAALDLWRVLLGYGLALPRVGAYLRAAAPYLSRRDDDDDDDSLFAASWTHALADATDCAAALTACHRFKRTLVLTPHQRDALAGTGALFGPRARECAERPVTAHPAGTAARLRFLASYVAACAPTPLSAALVEGEEEKVFDETLLTRGDFVSALPARACATCLRSVMSDEQWTRALRIALTPARDDDDHDHDHDHDDHYAGIVEHGLTLAHNLSTARFRRYDDDDPADEIDEVLSELGTSVSRTLEDSRARGTDRRQPRRESPARRAARAWAALFAARASRDDPARTASVRRLVVDVLGALVPGEEALAVLLLEEDASPLPRSVRRVLLRTLRGDGRARAQATHSATRLRIRAVPDHDARGPFALRSRRPDADAAPVAAERRAPPRLLPLGGPSWPWHLLSGGANDDDDEEAVEVVRDALTLLEELAGEDPGREIYHLCNVALRPEAVVRDDAVDATFARLFERLVGSSANDDDAFDRSFARACAAHARGRATDDDDDDDDDEELVNSPFCPPSTDHELRALKDLVDDVRTVFLEHGAQYRACVLVARTLLRPGLPSSVVAEALRGLRGVGSFLDLEEEREDRALLVRRLAQHLRAGGPRREPPEVLDALAGTLDGRDPGGYGRALAVARLARDLARATNETTTALRRLANGTFPSSAREAVLRTARAWTTSTTGNEEEDSAREASSRDEDSEARALARDATDAEEWRRRATAWLSSSSFRTA